MKFLYNKLVVVLPFLSQADLLGWSKNLTNGMETIYDKAMDAEYIKTNIGGAYHRLFDGGHSPINAWEKVKNASDTDILSQEVIGYAKILKKTKTMVFLICHLKSDDKIVASASGIWKKLIK